MNTVNDGSTEKMTVNQKLELLRTKMKERGMDAYMVPTADFHESEYVGDHLLYSYSFSSCTHTWLHAFQTPSRAISSVT